MLSEFSRSFTIAIRNDLRINLIKCFSPCRHYVKSVIAKPKLFLYADFTRSFTIAVGNDLHTTYLKNFSPHLYCVVTLPEELIIQE